ncbi:acyloxyacyl hydrolase [Caenimonas sedimenti]|uniref:Lipid A deacylase n=2 Tax=Caenimonas sedimenti TaxID=2596921 RepID=A0A562ZS34_9BURK|nr:acyloxyacyl hydrolase [Caenimonas sedimenti]
MRLASLIPPLLAALFVAPAAADWQPDAYYLQGGWSRHHAASATVGAVWDADWRHSVWGLQASVQGEVFLSAWRAEDFSKGHQWFYQAGLLPVLRLRPAEGRSPWFLEGGIGLSYTNRPYITPIKQFSTKFNFYDIVGLGYSFDGGRQEIGLRYVHISNADIRKPNPGEDFVLLRYARRF